MKHITELKDIGIGKRCLIIGGGHSVNDINIDDYPDCVIIGTNDHHYRQSEIIVYFDKDIKDFYSVYKVTDKQKLIGFKHKGIDNTVDQCTHYYNYNDMIFGDTGFHTLQFADKIFNFSEIFLIGYDYEVKGNSYHYDEINSDKIKQDRFINWSIGKVIEKYYCMHWNNEITNLNKNSSLDVFS